MLRSHRAGLPGRWVFSLLMLMVALSVLWPRYIFFSIRWAASIRRRCRYSRGLPQSLFLAIYSPAFSERSLRAVSEHPSRTDCRALGWYGA